jgi:hypothetical protein
MVKMMTRKRQLKTFLMSLIETRHAGQTIEMLMVDAFRQHGTEQAASQALGITQQTFNAWKYRLNLEETISNIGINTPSTVLESSRQSGVFIL